LKSIDEYLKNSLAKSPCQENLQPARSKSYCRCA